jgi:hypothetical protein
MAVTVKSTVFGVTMPCRWERARCFGVIYRFHFQGSSVRQEKNIADAGGKKNLLLLCPKISITIALKNINL